jgi:cellulose synthase/poly-beta-1,6-N-acetylglucosamine synthase-like glycosyltransferase
MVVYLVSIFAALSLGYLGVILFLRRGLASIGGPGPAQELEYSVIIAAHNEEAVIGSCLDALFKQTLAPGRFDVILVADRCTDRTGAIAESFRDRNPHFSIVTIDDIPPDVAPKKHALSRGIELAHRPVLVFTDADCLVPSTWLETIDRYFSPEVGLVQGVTTFRAKPEIGRILFGLQAVDFLSHGIVSAAAIGAGLPINSNANNFAFRREAFNEVGGYGLSRTVVSGDDDLLLQRIWRVGKWRIRYMADQSGSVLTDPTMTARGVLEQRKRWGSKTVHYAGPQVAVLTGIFLFYLAIPLSLIAGLWNHLLLVTAAAMLTIKFAGELALMLPGTRMFACQNLRPFLIPASLLQLPVVLYAVVSGVFGRFEWKGQRHGRTVGR